MRKWQASTQKCDVTMQKHPGKQEKMLGKQKKMLRRQEKIPESLFLFGLLSNILSNGACELKFASQKQRIYQRELEFAKQK